MDSLESVQEAAVKSSDEVATAEVKPSTASTEKSNEKEIRLAAEQPKVDRGINWLHPLADCKLEYLSMRPLNVETTHGTCGSVPVLWNDDVYMVGSTSVSAIHIGRYTCKMFKYSTLNDYWSVYNIPCDKESHRYDEQVHTLTTYHSKLLLFGDSNRVWEFDTNVSTFKPSPDIILPQSRKVRFVTAASEGDYLLVIRRVSNMSWTSINIYDGDTWMIRDGSHKYFESWSRLHTIIHNHCVYLIKWHQDSHGTVCIYKADLQSLLNNEYDIWQEIWSTSQQSSQYYVSNLTHFDSHICILTVAIEGGCAHIILWYYLAHRKDWLELIDFPCDEVPLSHAYIHVTGLPDQSLMMTFEQNHFFQHYTSKLKPVAIYHPHDNLTIRAVVKLELGANIPVLTKLEPKLNELSQRAKFIPLDEEVLRDCSNVNKCCDKNEFSKTVMYINSWVECWHVSSGVILPSWKNFYAILKEISPELGNLADQIESYFSQYLTILPEAESNASKMVFRLRATLAHLGSHPIDLEVVKAGLRDCISTVQNLEQTLFRTLKSSESNISKLKEELANICSCPDDVELVRAKLNKCVKICDGINTKRPIVEQHIFSRLKPEQTGQSSVQSEQIEQSRVQSKQIGQSRLQSEPSLPLLQSRVPAEENQDVLLSDDLMDKDKYIVPSVPVEESQHVDDIVDIYEPPIQENQAIICSDDLINIGVLCSPSPTSDSTDPSLLSASQLIKHKELFKQEFTESEPSRLEIKQGETKELSKEPSKFYLLQPNTPEEELGHKTVAVPRLGVAAVFFYLLTIMLAFAISYKISSSQAVFSLYNPASEEHQSAPPGIQFLYLRTHSVIRSPTTQTIALRKFGILLHFPPNITFEPLLKITIGVSLSGSVTLSHNNMSLVSAMYYIKVLSKLLQPITVELQHCVTIKNSSSISSMKFGKAKSENYWFIPPYHFEMLPEGNFTVGHSWGTIKMSHFCLLGIFWCNDIPPSISYLAGVLSYQQVQRKLVSHKMLLLTGRNLAVNKEMIRKEFSEWTQIVQWFSFKFVSESETLSLNISENGDISGHWKIQAIVSPPKISKSEIDFHNVISCELRASWMNKNEGEGAFEHTLSMSGIDKRSVTIIIDEQGRDQDYCNRQESILHHNEIKNFHDLFHAVANISNWRGLCVNLHVDLGTIDAIARSGEAVVNKKYTCLESFFNTGNATWEAVIKAVAKYPVNNRRVAQEIANTQHIDMEF